MESMSVSVAEILFVVKDGLGVMTLNRPRALNALSVGMIREMERMLPPWEKDPQVKAVIVDDWHEVCRENTDIQQLHRQFGLGESDVRTLADVVCRGGLAEIADDAPVFFNPMGLGVFDIAIAGYYLRQAGQLGKGVLLED